MSVGWGWKISAVRNRTGLIGRQGRRPRVTVEVLDRLREWVLAKPDHTLAELQRRLQDEADFKLSISRLWQLLRQLGLRLKKVTPLPGA